MKIERHLTRKKNQKIKRKHKPRENKIIQSDKKNKQFNQEADAAVQTHVLLMRSQ